MREVSRGADALRKTIANTVQRQLLSQIADDSGDQHGAGARGVWQPYNNFDYAGARSDRIAELTEKVAQGETVLPQGFAVPIRLGVTALGLFPAAGPAGHGMRMDRLRELLAIQVEPDWELFDDEDYKVMRRAMEGAAGAETSGASGVQFPWDPLNSVVTIAGDAVRWLATERQTPRRRLLLFAEQEAHRRVRAGRGAPLSGPDDLRALAFESERLVHRLSRDMDRLDRVGVAMHSRASWNDEHDGAVLANWAALRTLRFRTEDYATRCGPGDTLVKLLREVRFWEANGSFPPLDPSPPPPPSGAGTTVIHLAGRQRRPGFEPMDRDAVVLRFPDRPSAPGPDTAPNGPDDDPDPPLPPAG